MDEAGNLGWRASSPDRKTGSEPPVDKFQDISSVVDPGRSGLRDIGPGAAIEGAWPAAASAARHRPPTITNVGRA